MQSALLILIAEAIAVYFLVLWAHSMRGRFGLSHFYALIGGLTADQQAQIHELCLPGVTFEEESGRDYPLDTLAAHVIGFTSKDGLGLAGAEKAFDSAIRTDRTTSVPLSIDLRVQGARENELDNAASAYQADDAVGMVVNVRTGEILGFAQAAHRDTALHRVEHLGLRVHHTMQQWGISRSGADHVNVDIVARKLARGWHIGKIGVTHAPSELDHGTNKLL